MSVLQLRVFGVPQAERAGRIYTVPRIKPLALLAYLAIEGGVHPRERLAALLWPEMDEQSGRANLRTTLAMLRRALDGGNEDAGLWRTGSDAVGIEPGAVLADTGTIATAATLARGREAPPGLVRQLDGAISIYRGPLLDGISPDVSPDYDTWLLSQRETYHRHMGAILHRLAALREDEGDLQGVAETLERLLRHDPLDATTYRRLLETYLALGDTINGRRVYEAYHAMHAAEWGGEPDPETVALARRLHGVTMPARSVSDATGRERSLSGVVTPPLVGRAGEMASLRARYARARAGDAQVVVVAGMDGMGKTRLAAEFVDWTAAQGADVLQGRAFEPAGSLPYGALAEALRPRMERENAPDDLLGDLWLAELARLLPELAERYPDLPAVEANRMEGPANLSEAVARLLTAWAERRPVVLFLDDMQWADEATRSLLLYAVRRWTMGGARILVLLAAQTGAPAAAPGLTSWLSRFGREAATTHLDLCALPEGAATEMVRALAGATDTRAEARLSAWLHSASGGVPLLMVDLLHGLLDAGLLGFRASPAGDWALDLTGLMHTPDWRPDALPARLRDTIVQHLACLHPAAGDVLLIGAIWGGKFTFEQVCRLADKPDDAIAGALDGLVQARLLVDSGNTGRYSFPHELLRALVYAQAGAARRRMLHRRALVSADVEQCPASELAHHAPATGTYGRGIACGPASPAVGEAATGKTRVAC